MATGETRLRARVVGSRRPLASVTTTASFGLAPARLAKLGQLVAHVVAQLVDLLELKLDRHVEALDSLLNGVHIHVVLPTAVPPGPTDAEE
jgi:hypothetical protein